MKQYEKVMIALIAGVLVIILFSIIPFKGIEIKKPAIGVFEQKVIKIPINETNCNITGEIALKNEGDTVNNAVVEVTAVDLKGTKVGLYSLAFPVFEKDTIKRKGVSFVVEIPCEEIAHLESNVKSYE